VAIALSCRERSHSNLYKRQTYTLYERNMPKIGRAKHLEPENVRKIRELVKAGFSLRKTAIKTGTSYSTVYKYAAQFSNRQTHIRLSVFSECEWGYIVGLFVGDGSRMLNKKTGHYGLKFGFDSKRDLEIVSFVRTLFEKSGKHVSCYSEGAVMIVKIYSKELLHYLLEFVDFAPKEGVAAKTLKAVNGLEKQFIMGFLGGLIDADGHVYVDRSKNRHFGASITTANTELLEQLKNLLSQVEVEAKIHKFFPYKGGFSKKPYFHVRLSAFEFRKICSKIICVKHAHCECSSKNLLAQ
jgi:hypothetical protein